MALRVGLTVVKGGTNNNNDKAYCWQRVGLTAENSGTNIDKNCGSEQSETLEFRAR